MKIFIDDNRPCPEGYLQFTKGERFIDFLSSLTEDVEAISFDHDLGNPKHCMSGYDLVKTLVADYPQFFNRVGTVYVHSSNTVGRENIRQYLKNAQRAGVISNEVVIFPHFLTAQGDSLVDSVTYKVLA